MAQTKPQMTRLQFIDRKIQEGGYPNCTTLAREWEISRKTIQRDIEYMRYQLDAPITYSSKHRGYYYTEANFKLPAINMKESDLFAIYLAEELLNEYAGTPLYKQLSSILNKIKENLPDITLTEAPPDKAGFTVFCRPSTMVNPAIWEQMFNCLRSGRTLEMEYTVPGQPTTRRLFEPYHTVRYDGDWYVTGHCHERKAIRTFSLSRISQVTPQDDFFTIPQSFDFKTITASRFGLHWGDEVHDIKIWFSKAIAPYIEERQWHPSQNIATQPDGAIIFSIEIDHTLELKRWILSWGKEARVLEPVHFREELEREIQAMSQAADPKMKRA